MEHTKYAKNAKEIAKKAIHDHHAISAWHGYQVPRTYEHAVTCVQIARNARKYGHGGKKEVS